MKMINITHRFIWKSRYEEKKSKKKKRHIKGNIVIPYSDKSDESDDEWIHYRNPHFKKTINCYIGLLC